MALQAHVKLANDELQLVSRSFFFLPRFTSEGLRNRTLRLPQPRSQAPLSSSLYVLEGGRERMLETKLYSSSVSPGRTRGTDTRPWD